MGSSETRSVKQCTYTPSLNVAGSGGDKSGAAPQRPFLKQAALGVVFGNPTETAGMMEQIHPLPQYKDNVVFDKLKKAVELIWNGDAAGAAMAMNNMSLETVVRFAEDALTARAAMLAQARADMANTLDEPAKAQQPAVGPDQDIEKQLESRRESIKGELKPAGSPVRRVTIFRRPPQILGANKPPEGLASSSGKAPVAIGRESIQAHMEANHQASAGFLRRVGYFSQAAPVSGFSVNESARFDTFAAGMEQADRAKRDHLRGIALQEKQEPVGYLHLERMDFTPVGYEPGELVYSLPMTPGETVRLTHREWSRTEAEYTKLVTTELETATQEALSEKTELTESFKAEEQHSSAYNASVTSSGGYGPINISATAGYNATNSESKSRESASKRSREVTKAASSRAKQEHKVTFKVATQYEVEDQSYRELTNRGDRAIRWDFYRLMKKWQIDLYRYDVRMTYDIVIPEPASYLLRKYSQLAWLNWAMSLPNPFWLSPEHITRENVTALEQCYQVTLEPPPPRFWTTEAHDEQRYSGERTVGWGSVEITLPPDYCFFVCQASGVTIYRVKDEDKLIPTGYLDPMESINQQRLMGSYSNTFTWQYYYDWSEEAAPPKGAILMVYVEGQGELSEEAFRAWQNRCYERLVDAAKTRYEGWRQRLAKTRDELVESLSRGDALMLRKIEREEITKGVLRWLLGPKFSFYPQELPDLSLRPFADLEYYDPDGQGVQAEAYEATIKHGELIKFLHHAIEWENVNYVLYPYFWTDVKRWNLKQALFHEDYERMNFLRAGAARVVLTIRPGYEKDFLSFMETCRLGQMLPDEHVYMTIAEEVKSMAETNYKYTPSANEENPHNLVDTWFEFTPTGALDVVEGTTLDR